jgi:hypothetical protein
VGRVRAAVAFAAAFAACAPPAASPPTVALDTAPPTIEAVPLPEPVVLPRYDPIRPSTVYLAEGYRDTEPRRAKLARAATLAWTLDGALNDDEPAVPAKDEEIPAWRSKVTVTEQHADHLRVLWTGDGLRATFYAPREAFHEVIATRVTMHHVNGHPFATSSGVTLPAGLLPELEVEEPSRAHRRLTVRNSWLLARGSVPHEAIDPVYVPAKAPPHPDDDAELTTPVALLDGPNGELVADVTIAGTSRCRRLGGAVEGFQKVELHDGGIRVVGFAPSAHVNAVPSGGYGRGFGGHGRGGWGRTDTQFLYLWPGDLLRGVGTSEPVAVATKRRLKVVDHGPGEAGRHSVRAMLGSWGFVGFDLDSDTLARVQQRQTAWLDRVTYGKPTLSPKTPSEEVDDYLAWRRKGFSACFDRILGDSPGTSIAYDIEVTVNGEDTKATYRPIGTRFPKFEKCLDLRLRSYRVAMKGAQIRFRVDLAPDPELDATPIANP